MSDKTDGVKRRYGKPMDMSMLKRTAAWRFQTHEHKKRLADALVSVGLRDRCPICGGDKITPCATVFSFDYVSCDACGHVFYRQVAKEGGLDALYEGETSYLDHMVDEKFHKIRIDLIAKPKVEYISEMVAHQTGDAWFDIGCGGCDILFAAREKGWCVRGVEPGLSGVKAGEALHIDVTPGYLTSDNAATLIGDSRIVSLFDVIEHLFDPASLVRLVAETMRPGASIVLEVPRHPSLSSLSCMLHPQKATRHMIPPEHLHLFTEQSMAVLLMATGLTLTHVWRYGQDFYEIMSALTMLANQEIDMWPKELFASFNDVQKVIDEHGLSDCLLVIARKPA